MKSSKPNGLAQNQTTKVKTKQELPVSDSGSAGSPSVDEALIDKAPVTRFARQKLLKDHCDAFGQPSLADARSGQPEGRRNGADAPRVADILSSPEQAEKNRQAEEAKERERLYYERTLMEKISHLNKPNLPAIKKKLAVDHLGYPSKRKYRRIVPENRDDLNVMDEMTPEELDAYVRGDR